MRNHVQSWIQKHPIIAFPLVYLGWAYLFWSPIFFSDESVWAYPNIIWFLLGGASPVIAGLSLALLSGGKEQLLDLKHRLFDWRRISGSWWLAILVFWLCFDLLMAFFAIMFGITDSPLDVHWSLFIEPQQLLFLILLSFVFPAIEEIGLRGFYLDALQKRLSTTMASLINGLVWAVWHAPFVYFPGYYANTTFHPELYWWLPMIVCHTLMITHVYNSTHRSILAVLIFHAMMNFTGEWLRISPDMYPFVLYGNLLLAVLLILFWKRKR